MTLQIKVLMHNTTEILTQIAKSRVPSFSFPRTFPFTIIHPFVVVADMKLPYLLETSSLHYIRFYATKKASDNFYANNKSGKVYC